MSKSSVLVRGMEMPLRCFECPCCHTIGYFECVLMHKDLREEHGINISRPDWCPLIEVKTSHGRLGDLDALVKTLEQNRLCYVLDIDDESFELGIDKAISIVKEAPTIIEAKG